MKRWSSPGGDYEFWHYAGVCRAFAASTNAVAVTLTFTRHPQSLLALYLMKTPVSASYAFIFTRADGQPRLRVLGGEPST